MFSECIQGSGHVAQKLSITASIKEEMLGATILMSWKRVMLLKGFTYPHNTVCSMVLLESCVWWFL